MPRIIAPSLAEHVRQQKDRILQAASELFRRRGYRATDLGDIAEAVGLARNSLYRYYRSKDHILLDCIRRDLLPFLDELRALEIAYPAPRPRIDAWLDAQIELACGPAHATMELMSEIQTAAPDLRQEIMALHRLPNEILSNALSQIFRHRKADLALITAMISAMVLAAAGHALRGGKKAQVKREMKKAVGRLLDQ
jgi:AcrR family transcriptional regulator